MSAPFRELENRVCDLLQQQPVRERVSRYVEENPKAANDPHLVMHALIAPLCRAAEKRDGWSEQDSWASFELFLQMGAYMTGGVHLSPAECKLVLQILTGERKHVQRRRPNTKRDIADYLELLEANGLPTEAAVARAQEVYDVVRETVYAAKRKRKEEAELLELEPKGRNMTAEALRNEIEFHQRQAAKWRRPKRPRRTSRPTMMGRPT